MHVVLRISCHFRYKIFLKFVEVLFLYDGSGRENPLLVFVFDYQKYRGCTSILNWLWIILIRFNEPPKLWVLSIYLSIFWMTNYVLGACLLLILINIGFLLICKIRSFHIITWLFTKLKSIFKVFEILLIVGKVDWCSLYDHRKIHLIAVCCKSWSELCLYVSIIELWGSFIVPFIDCINDKLPLMGRSPIYSSRSLTVLAASSSSSTSNYSPFLSCT